MPTQAIYVVVSVDYDYYRFQENLAASTSRDEALEFAKQESVRRGIGCDGDLPVIEDEKQSQEMDGPEKRHIWIQAFNAK